MIKEKTVYIVDEMAFDDRHKAEKYMNNKNWYLSSIYINGSKNTSLVHLGSIYEFLDQYRYEVMDYYSKFGKERK